MARKNILFASIITHQEQLKGTSQNLQYFAKRVLWDEVHVCLTVMQKDPPILVFIFIFSLISMFIHISLWGSFVCLVHSREAGLCSGAGVLLQESSCSTFLARPKFYLAPAIPTSSSTASTPGGKGPCCLSCHSCQSLLRRWKGTFQRAP